jgi:UDPglucose 6-dehydrogenase/GDP-mannose 6-dehydrogenase
MKIAIVGTGYVGLVSGVCLASKGHEVTAVDVRHDVVEQLRQGVATIHERGLPSLLQEQWEAGRFRATTQMEDALADAELVLVAVGTPSENGRIDLRHVEEASRAIGTHLRGRKAFLAVVVKSTVIPGTTDTVVRRVLEESSGKRLGEFGLGMNPEFLREGSAVEDFLEPDRIVLGAEDERTRELLQQLYAPWTCDKLAVNTRTAELIKYANNSLLATQISAINEIANLAAQLGGVDVMDVVRGVQLDKRWNPVLMDGTRAQPQILSYLVPGCGFGGSCFPKDVQALRSQGESLGLPMRMLQAILDVNAAQPGQIAALLGRQWPTLHGRRVLLLGLAFKPDTDDVRESASGKILADLLARGATVAAHDPVAMANARRAWPELSFVGVEDWQAEVAHCDAVVVATRWPEYLALQKPPLNDRLAGKVLVDARRFLDRNFFVRATYLTIGYTANR